MSSHVEFSRRSLLASTIGVAVAGATRSFGSEFLLPQGKAGLVSRSDFVFPSGMSYLNTASVGPSPRVVLEKVVETLYQIEQSPVVESYSKGSDQLEEVRRKLGKFLNCNSEEIVFTGCTTDAMNRLSFALGLKAGDHIISTDQEHEGGHDCWKFHARSRGVEIDDIQISLDEHSPQAIVDKFAAAIKPNTRAISFSHVFYTNGMRMPAEDICKLARTRGLISIVDGAQAVGSIAVDISKIGCDAYAAPGHKWLLGPKGTGFAYVSSAASSRLDLLTRLTTTKAQSDSTGLMNHMSLQGLGAAIDYVNRLGMSRVEQHNLSLHTYAYDRLQSLPVKTFSPRDGGASSPLLSFHIDKKFDTQKLIAKLLAEEKLVVKGLPKLNALRISTHLFNSEDDVNSAVSILKRHLI